MRFFKAFVLCLLLLTVPAMALHPVSPFSYFQEVPEKGRFPFSYDNVIHILDQIEYEEIETLYHSDELEYIEACLIALSREGLMPGDDHAESLLEEDIYALVHHLDAAHFCLVDPSDTHSQWLHADPYNFYTIMPCSWLSKKWKKVRHFVKKHKKAIIIGAAIVAATATAVGIIAAASAGSVVAGSSAAANKSDKKREPQPPLQSPSSDDTPHLKAAIEEQVTSFKENIVKEQLGESNNPASFNQELSWEEKGRIMGSLLANDSLDNLRKQIAAHPTLAAEMQKMSSRYDYFQVDHKLLTDCSHLFTSNQTPHLNALFHQAKGETASALGLDQAAIRDFGKAIEITSHNPSLYLDRGKAHFDLGNYDQAIEDYHRFTTHSPQDTPLISSDFHLGFAQGVGKGIYESGSQLIVLASDLIRHPIATSKQMYEAITSLSKLAYEQQWGHLAEVLVPEVYELAQKWDSLPPKRKGELAGLAFGKHGADILIPGSLAKIAAKGVKELKGLTSVCKGFHTAEKTLLLESAAEVGSGSHVAEIIQSKMVAIAEKLGFNDYEIAQLQNIGKIEGSLAKHIPNASQDINFANHALQRAIERGVSKESILDSLASPLKIEEVRLDNLGRPSQRFIGKKAEVVINPETQQIVSVNPTSTKKVEKLKNELKSVKDRAE